MAGASTPYVAVVGASQATAEDMRDAEAVGALIARAAEAMIAIGGAYGTLSEVALGLSAGLAVYGLHTWEIDGTVAVGTPEAAVERALAAARSR